MRLTTVTTVLPVFMIIASFFLSPTFLFPLFLTAESLLQMEKELENLQFTNAPAEVVTEDWDEEVKETPKTVTANSEEVDMTEKDAVTDNLEGVFVR